MLGANSSGHDLVLKLAVTSGELSPQNAISSELHGRLVGGRCFMGLYGNFILKQLFADSLVFAGAFNDYSSLNRIADPGDDH